MPTHSGTMLVIVIPFLVLVGPCQGFPEQVPDTATITNDLPEVKWASVLKVHEAKTASLLRDQEAKTASLLRKLDNKWTYVLRDQQAEMALLTAELVNTKGLLRQQALTLSRQDKLHRQQEKKLSDQEDLLRHQGQTLSHQYSMLREQGARLSYQEALRTREQPKDRSLQSQFSPDEILRHSANVSQPETGLIGKTAGSASHDVMPRSDDTGPWEAVMSHISQQVTEMGADIQTLQNSNTQQDLAIQDAQSSTFVHWGSSTCSNLSHTVYSGVVGGSRYDHVGAATNYLCLTMSPVFSDHTVPPYVAFLYGTEYETVESRQDKDPVCSVCRSTLSTTVMIPGTNVCTPGWHMQYSGFLMAGLNSHAAGSEYICVDSKLDYTIHGDANDDGALLYHTVTRCGSLPCTPYINNKVVTCTVCSK